MSNRNIRPYECHFEAELHFEDKDELPKRDRLIEEVRIVQVKDKGELIIEQDLDNKNKMIIGIGGLSLKLKKADFYKAWTSYFKDVK